jgi:PAS domain S-box-containing protein
LKKLHARIEELEQELKSYKTAQKALFQGGEHLRTILETSPVGVGIFRNCDDIITFANSRCFQLLGYAASYELIGRNIHEHWNQKEEFERFKKSYARWGLITETEVSLQTQQGSPFTGLVSWYPMQVEDEACTLFWIFDVTQLKKAKSEIQALNDHLEATVEKRTRQARESEERTRNFAEVSSDWFWEMDADLRLTFLSKRFEEITGFTRDDWLGGRRTDFVQPQELREDSEKWAAHLDDLKARRPFKNFEYSSNGEALDSRLFTTSGQPVFDEAGTFVGYRGTGTDITERKQLEAKLQQSQRMEAIGQLTGGLAHDFNNLLGIMLGNAELLQRILGEQEQPQSRLASIVSAVKRGASLTERMLAFSRQQALLPENTKISVLVEGLEDLLRRTLSPAVEIKIETMTDDWLAIIDQNQFENALINLAINARDAMPDGGNLTISTSCISVDEVMTNPFEDITPGDYVRVRVSDTGTGMTPEIQRKAIEPFFTTKDVGKGSGLGLSMVYGFVKQSNGNLVITSEIGVGTTIILYLPRSIEGQIAPKPVDDHTQPRHGTERILVVEDDANLRELANINLREFGYAVTLANDGDEAIDHMRQGSEFDLLFTDVVLPGSMNGVEIAEQARQIQPSIKILFTTGYARSAALVDAPDDVHTNLIKKPYHLNDLHSKIRAALDSPSCAGPPTRAADRP